jgi:hypothetical protein
MLAPMGDALAGEQAVDQLQGFDETLLLLGHRRPGGAQR